MIAFNPQSCDDFIFILSFSIFKYSLNLNMIYVKFNFKFSSNLNMIDAGILHDRLELKLKIEIHLNKY